MDAWEQPKVLFLKNVPVILKIIYLFYIIL